MPGCPLDRFELTLELLAVAMHGIFGDTIALLAEPGGEIAVTAEAVGDDLGLEALAHGGGQQVDFGAGRHARLFAGPGNAKRTFGGVLDNVNAVWSQQAEPFVAFSPSMRIRWRSLR
ncbi:MAG TPA: hypothetical protein VMF50_17370 [Candidatus Binataceae bacterium]|nr:hypothetical protein [Candidatus Binataceae bacterium]